MKNLYLKNSFLITNTHQNEMKLKKIHGIDIYSHQYYIIHDQRQCVTPPEFEVLLLELIHTWEVTPYTNV
mgnify:CR=1 FL=1|jgi:hypothetical protein